MIPVHILFTLRKQELEQYSYLVFRSLRTGFPTSKIFVHVNPPSPITEEAKELFVKCDAEVDTLDKTVIHHDWISSLLETITEPVFICDTDVMFWRSFEDQTFDKPMAGRRIPQWYDEFTGCNTRSRLHTSLLYLDPNGIRDRVDKYYSGIHQTPFNPTAHLINPICVPLYGRTYFYDTCSLLYHSIGGQPFTERQLDSFDHLNFGTISDIVLPRLKDGEQMHTIREAVIKDPHLAQGCWREQEEYYLSRPVKT